MQLLLDCKRRFWRRPFNLKFFLALKMISLLLSFACLQLAAKGYSQSITLSLKNASLQKVFKEIEKQTPYHFFYSTEAINLSHSVTIDVKNETLENVLNICFNNQPISYSIEDKLIIVKIDDEKKNSDNSFHDVRGRVTNEHGEVISDASILVKETNKGTATNQNGEFVLTDVPPNSTLIISHVGYLRQEIKLQGRSTITVQLNLSVNSLDETVVIAYGTTTRRLNTGSVGRVTAADIGKQPVSNPLAALEGRVPGLLITQSNGLPGSNFSVRIRGQNSIQSGNSPLYIIDGVPFLNDGDLLTQRSLINASSPFNTINPDDIQSIEVLKDADATAIYGSRGANGVILITTKKGQEGKTNLNLNYYSGWGKVTRTMEYLNTTQYLEMRHEAFRNDGVTPTPANAFDFLVWDSTSYTDLKKLLIGGTAHTDNFNARLTGGNFNTKFSLGGNYYRETTVFPGSTAYNRATADLSVTNASSNNKFNTTISISYSADKSSLIPQDLTQFINLPPTIPTLYDSSGKLNWNRGGFSFYNPLSVTLQHYDVRNDRLTASAVFNYLIVPKVNLKANVGYNDVNADESISNPICSQDPSISPKGTAFFGTSRFKNWIIEPQAEFKSLVGKTGKIQILIGATWQENSNKRTSISATGYTNDNLLNSTIGAQSITTKNGYELYRYQAMFGRLNYLWYDRYILNLSGRRDGSSRFGPGKQYANFGAIGTAWIFSKEKLIQKYFPILSFGKFRGSYGITGNDLIGNYQFLDTYSGTQYPYQGQPSLFPNKLFNPDYSWEQIRKLDVGFDLGIAHDRILITADWFENKSDNQIINYSLPGQTGFTYVLKNFPGVVENKGTEFSITSTNIKSKNFDWQSSFNITFNHNRLVKFPDLESSSYSTRYIIGKPLNCIIGAVFVGVDPQSGVYEFLDKDKNSTFTPSPKDYQYLGTTDPKYYGGLQNSISYSNWQLDFLLEFRRQQGKDVIYSANDLVGSSVNEPTAILNRWQKSGDISPYQKFTQTYGPAGTATFYMFNSSAYLTDASFIRLKNLSLSYTLPKSWTTKSKISSCRFYIAGQNLLVLTNYKGADPEVQTLRALPPLRMIAAGIQITF